MATAPKPKPKPQPPPPPPPPPVAEVSLAPFDALTAQLQADVESLKADHAKMRREVSQCLAVLMKLQHKFGV